MLSGTGFLAARGKSLKYSRTTLNKYSLGDADKELRLNFNKTLIAIICSEVDELLNRHGGTVKHYVCKGIRCVKLWRPNYSYGNHFRYYLNRGGFNETAPDPEAEKYLPEFIELLQKTFVDCTITLDPLKTYLMIDWS